MQGPVVDGFANYKEKEENTMMKITAAVVAVCAGSAFAGPVLGQYATYTQISNDQISAVTLGESIQGVSESVYSNMDAGTGFQAFPAGNGVLGADDYTSTQAGSITLDTFRFVGGVDAAGGTLNFEFFNAAGDTLVDAFSVSLVDAGNFIYTITIGGDVNIDGAGILQVSTDATSNGQWFLSDAGPTIGTEDNTMFGANGGLLSHKFELNQVPAPGSVALLGLGGLVATRRRR